MPHPGPPLMLALCVRPPRAETRTRGSFVHDAAVFAGVYAVGNPWKS